MNSGVSGSGAPIKSASPNAPTEKDKACRPYVRSLVCTYAEWVEDYRCPVCSHAGRPAGVLLPLCAGSGLCRPCSDGPQYSSQCQYSRPGTPHTRKAMQISVPEVRQEVRYYGGSQGRRVWISDLGADRRVGLHRRAIGGLRHVSVSPAEAGGDEPFATSDQPSP